MAINSRGVTSDTLRVASEAVANLSGGTDRRVIARAMWTGLWTWPAFALLDAYMCFVAYPAAPFRVFLVYRIVIELLFVLGYRASLREDVGVIGLFRWQSLTFIATALTIALMAIHLGGIRSPYMHGISIVALVWAALVPTHWRRAVPTFLGIGLAFPFVIGVSAALSPAARAEWITADALIVFGSNYVFVLASSALGVILCHMVWSAQQQARKIGSYELVDRLGRGGMGEVWRARHHLLAREAAIKLIRPEVLGGDTESRDVAVARFEREAQTTASLRSPHTIALYDFGMSDTGTFYYVMELLDGYDAQVLVEQFGPLPPARVVHLLVQACDSLSEAHASALVHRDIKPSNIHICRYGHRVDFVKVLDLGLVKLERDGDDAETRLQLTAAHVVSGTAGYMAPEQIVGGAALDARTDLYALGCVAFWLLTGRTVFEGATIMDILTQQARDDPPAPSNCTEMPIPPELDQVILRCLSRDPQGRPQSADDLAQALTAACGSERWTAAQARNWWEERHVGEQT